MRLIWTCENIDYFRTFVTFLSTKNIAFSTEDVTNKDWGSDQYGNKKLLLWIQDEDQVEAAMQYLTRFLEDPTQEEFTKVASHEKRSDSPVTQYLEQKLHRHIVETSSEPEKHAETHLKLTTLIVLLCSLLFLFDLWNERGHEPPPPAIKQTILSFSPVKRVLLFDYPKASELRDKVITIYGYQAYQLPQELPQAGKFIYDQSLQLTEWEGFYPYIVTWAKSTFMGEKVKEISWQEKPLFEKMREGQVWRLVTPALLHGDILHLFFNMIWLLLLGAQIESRLGAWRYFVLMILIAAVSNVAQYFMTGPNFIGFSGIICGMATFIKARQKIAPWEGYQMSSSTFAFICFFIGTLALLSMLTFVLDVAKNISFPIAIANTAHLTGALIGYWLGQMRIFSWNH